MTAVKLSKQDIDYIARVVDTEVNPGWARSHPQVHAAMVAAVVDTIVNRVASTGFPDKVTDVVNAQNQFSKINGPSRLSPYGSVQAAPKAQQATFDIVESHLTGRARGLPSSIGAHVNYANPHHSDKKNREGWINPMIEAGAIKLGIGESVHYHGTAKDAIQPGSYAISIDGLEPTPDTFGPTSFGWSGTNPSIGIDGVNPRSSNVAYTSSGPIGYPQFAPANRPTDRIAIPTPNPRGFNIAPTRNPHPDLYQAPQTQPVTPITGPRDARLAPVSPQNVALDPALAAAVRAQRTAEAPQTRSILSDPALQQAAQLVSHVEPAIAGYIGVPGASSGVQPGSVDVLSGEHAARQAGPDEVAHIDWGHLNPSRSIRGMQTRGNFTGWGWNGGKWNGTDYSVRPVDTFDGMARGHDHLYDQSSNAFTRFQADNKLIADILNARGTPDWNKLTTPEKLFYEQGLPLGFTLKNTVYAPVIAYDGVKVLASKLAPSLFPPEVIDPVSPINPESTIAVLTEQAPTHARAALPSLAATGLGLLAEPAPELAAYDSPIGVLSNWNDAGEYTAPGTVVSLQPATPEAGAKGTARAEQAPPIDPVNDRRTRSIMPGSVPVNAARRTTSPQFSAIATASPFSTPASQFANPASLGFVASQLNSNPQGFGLYDGIEMGLSPGPSAQSVSSQGLDEIGFISAPVTPTLERTWGSEHRVGTTTSRQPSALQDDYTPHGYATPLNVHAEYERNFATPPATVQPGQQSQQVPGILSSNPTMGPLAVDATPPSTFETFGPIADSSIFSADIPSIVRSSVATPPAVQQNAELAVTPPNAAEQVQTAGNTLLGGLLGLGSILGSVMRSQAQDEGILGSIAENIQNGGLSGPFSGMQAPGQWMGGNFAPNPDFSTNPNTATDPNTGWQSFTNKHGVTTLTGGLKAFPEDAQPMVSNAGIGGGVGSGKG